MQCDMMIMSLRTLPKLTRLVCPFKKEDEEKIKRGLHTLEFLNNSKSTLGWIRSHSLEAKTQGIAKKAE